MRRLIALAACAAFALAAPAFGDGRPRATPDVAAPPVQRAPVRAAPIPQAEPAAAPIGQRGAVALPADTGLALNVPRSYRYYDAGQAQAYLIQNSAAAPRGTVLGLLLPEGQTPSSEGARGTVIAFDAIGHVAVDDAAANTKLADAAFEGEVRAARTTQQRPFEGFAAQPTLAGAGEPSLSWGERAAVPGAGGRDLRFEQRLMGRRGVASLTTIASLDQMGEVGDAAPTLLSMLAFGAGQRHSDFNAASDTASEWDVTELVLGQTTESLVADAASAGEPQTATATGGGLLGGMFPWIAGGVALLAGAGYFVARTLNRTKEAPAIDEDDPANKPAAAGEPGATA
jgi:uncharacterized membrane-anchored protein